MYLYTDDYFMNEAMKLAKLAYEEGEIPVGAIIVCRNKIIAKAYNQTEKLTDVTAHAEILAITSAANALGAKYLTECKMYVTLEPCAMCASAISISRIRRVYFCLEDKKSGGFINGPKLIYSNNLHHKPKFYYGFKENVFLNLMKNFFKKKRN